MLAQPADAAEQFDHRVHFACCRLLNVPPRVAQTLARHSTISLTMDRYTHLGTADLVAGLKRLPVMAGNGLAKI